MLTRRQSIFSGALAGVTACMSGAGPSAAAAAAPLAQPRDLFAGTRDQRIDWWRRARFGMFLHWGLYTVPARGEWLMATEDIPRDEYAKWADDFIPRPGAPREWARLAKQAGMKYMVLTTKHHEGFCLFNTKLTDFSAVKSAARRDLIADYVDALRAEGIRVGFYFSLMDWRHPDGLTCARDPEARKRFVAFVHGQVRELMTNYGQVDILWYDMAYPLDAAGFESEKLNQMVFELQPNIIINNRSGYPGDFATPEQSISASGRYWESCMTLNDNWGFNRYDHNFKPASAVIANLVKCAAGGGNYLLDVGPRVDGSLPEECHTILSEVGAWLDRNGEAVYGTERSHVRHTSFGEATAKENKLFLHPAYWMTPDLVLPGVTAKATSARILSTGQPVRIEQQGERIVLRDLPQAPPESPYSVIEVSFDTVPVQHTLTTRIFADVLNGGKEE